jgi:hypothetical protein
MKRIAACLVGSLTFGANAHEQDLFPQVISFQSQERITHLVPGGANAARELVVTVALFDKNGDAATASGYPFEVSAFDGGPGGRDYPVGSLAGVTGANGTFSGRLALSECRTTQVEGPIRVHRTSNKPEYWDVTYAIASLRTGKETNQRAHFVHVCKEMYRGNRP